MSALIFTLRREPPCPVDLSPLTPDRLTGKGLDEIAKLTLKGGREDLPVGELFELSGTDPSTVHIRGACTRLEAIGGGMKSGSIRVEGNVGAYLGKQMRGGHLHVQGNAGPWAAVEMRGGRLEIDGDAGDFLAGALPGNRKGMSGGVVLVHGSVGERAGDHMRRGLIIVDRDAGAYCGARMIAGTLLVLGRVGPFPGTGMKRGTLLFTQPLAEVPALFSDCGTHELLFLQLLLRELTALDARYAGLDQHFGRVRRYAGDVGWGGKGEILVTEQGG